MIEALPGFQFLCCAGDADAAPDSGQGGDPCQDAGCCSVESANYHAPRLREIAPVIVVAIVPRVDSDPVEQLLPETVRPGILTGAPPDLPASWQFLSRAALPVRAPSSAS